MTRAEAIAKLEERAQWAVKFMGKKYIQAIHDELDKDPELRRAYMPGILEAISFGNSREAKFVHAELALMDKAQVIMKRDNIFFEEAFKKALDEDEKNARTYTTRGKE